MKKGLLALQFWGRDKADAMRLARFIADIEPGHRDEFDFLFVSRFDCDHDKSTIDYVARKFDVRAWTTRSRMTGHPMGCWGLWFGTLEWFFQMKEAKRIPDYRWLFTFEADSVPLTRNWIVECSDEFEQAGVNIFGSEILTDYHHVNGNMMLSGNLDFLKWLVLGVGIDGCPVGQGWDTFLAPQFFKWGAGFSTRIRSCWNWPTSTEEIYKTWLAEGVSFLHGVKDDSLYNRSRANLLRRPSLPALTNIL